MNFIDEEKIKSILEKSKNSDPDKIREIIEKSRNLKGLNPEEVAVLLQCNDKNLIESMFKAAKEIKQAIYGNRLVLFAPLYLSNICSNNCLYCGFRRDNKELIRKKLTSSEIKKEVETLINQGHKRLLLVAGEEDDINYTLESIKAVYSVKKDNGEIRRVNVNVAPLSVEEFKRLKSAGIGTYQCFQETYHKETYKKMHPSGPKSDYEKRLSAIDQAMEAGIDDIGIGVLFGLYDYRFEVLAMFYHCLHLEEKFGVGPHTISVPRIEPALNAPAANNIPYPVSDPDFKKMIAIIRMAVPYTGMILSTREKSSFRDEILELGISQISAGSRTNPGAYAEGEEHSPESEQFHLGDTRTMQEIIKETTKQGFYPSFCTACYRLGRTGKHFMDLAKPGDIKNYCIPNCILTFKEYLIDYADEELKEKGEIVIKNELEKINDERIKEKTKEKLKEIEDGKRDLYL